MNIFYALGERLLKTVLLYLWLVSKVTYCYKIAYTIKLLLPSCARLQNELKKEKVHCSGLWGQSHRIGYLRSRDCDIALRATLSCSKPQRSWEPNLRNDPTLHSSDPLTPLATYLPLVSFSCSSFNRLISGSNHTSI